MGQAVLLWALGTLTALAGAVQDSFEVRVWPEASVVEYGGSLWINCSNTCLDGNALGGLETSLTKAQSGHGPGWVAFHLISISEWTSAPVCYFTCDDLTKMVSAKISLYRVPEQVVLEQLPELELGQAYNLTCWVLNVAPVSHLTVTLFQGGQMLHTKAFQNDTRTGANNITVTHTINAQRQHHGQEATCHSALDLRPHGLLFSETSAAVELRVYAFPEPPRLHTPAYVEVGTEATVRCEVAGIFPAGEARFNLSFGGEPVTFTISTSDDTATAEAMVGSQAPGQWKLSCTVTVGPMSRSAEENVLVYSLPEPALEINEAQTLVNNSVTFTCRSPESKPPGILLQLKDTEQVLRTSTPPLVQFWLTAREEDNGRKFECVAKFNSSIPAMKSKWAQLSVTYPPRMDDSSCPSNHTWVEGTQQNFSCRAWGNPAPTVVCRKDGAPYDIGVLQLVSRQDTGTYHCEATNPHGQASKEVTVQVQYQPGMDDSSCPSKQTWVEGTQQNFLCRAWGNPAPTLVCRKNGAAYNIRVPWLVRRQDTGTYHCEATNALGQASWEVTIQVQYPPRMDDSSCPSNHTWVEGTQQNFSCRAWGNPAPTVVCKKEGATYDMGVLRLVSRQDAGIYHCIANNTHGQTSQEVTIQVQYHHINLLLVILLPLAVAVVAVLGVAGYFLNRRWRIRLKQTEEVNPVEQMQLRPNGATQDAPEVEHGSV